MTAPVDVLAVLDEFALYVRNVSSRHALQGDIMEARATVAELIAADKEYNAAIDAAKELNRRVAESGWFEVEFDALRNSGKRLVAAQARRDRALLAVGGSA